MTLLRTLICLAIIAAITVTANVVMSKYWVDMMENATEYADLMDDIPEEFGSWKRTKTAEIAGYAQEQLKTRRAENWTYVNEQTEETVHVSFLIGPTGRLAVHTPEACMDGRGFTVGEERQPESFPGDGSLTHDVAEADEDAATDNDRDTFWRVTIVSKVAASNQIVSYYALGTGKRWWAMKDPRFELAQYPFVLKIQVETLATDPVHYNAARNFLKEFLPEIAKVYANTDLQGKYDK